MAVAGSPPYRMRYNLRDLSRTRTILPSGRRTQSPIRIEAILALHSAEPRMPATPTYCSPDPIESKSAQRSRRRTSW